MISIEDNFKFHKNDIIVVGCSAGPDSMALLNLLNVIKKEKNIKIICAHVNHNLRKESKAEAQMVKDYCTQKNIIYEYMEIKEYKGNTENYAREKRYEFFENLLKKYHSKYLFTAHHGDDLIETVIMRLIRSSSLKGYGAFSEITEKKDYKIYRPLITKTKEEIFNYVKNNNLPYAIDKTNDSDFLTRNRIRKYILPKLKEENKNVHLKFLEFSKTLNETEKYLKKQTEKALSKVYIDKKIDINLFKKEDLLVQKRIIHHILNETYKENITKIKDVHVNNILLAVKNSISNSKINLPDNKIFIKSYNNAWIEENKKTKKYDIILKDIVELSNGYIVEIIKETESNSNYVTKINTQEINMPIHIRTR